MSWWRPSAFCGISRLLQGAGYAGEVGGGGRSSNRRASEVSRTGDARSLLPPPPPFSCLRGLIFRGDFVGNLVGFLPPQAEIRSPAIGDAHRERGGGANLSRSARKLSLDQAGKRALEASDPNERDQAFGPFGRLHHRDLHHLVRPIQYHVGP